MNFKLDVNYLDSLIKTSQSTDKLEDPIKKTICRKRRSKVKKFSKRQTCR